MRKPQTWIEFWESLTDECEVIFQTLGKRVLIFVVSVLLVSQGVVLAFWILKPAVFKIVAAYQYVFENATGIFSTVFVMLIAFLLIRIFSFDSE